MACDCKTLLAAAYTLLKGALEVAGFVLLFRFTAAWDMAQPPLDTGQLRQDVTSVSSTVHLRLPSSQLILGV